ncbi:MAG: hypothetical protein M0Z94_02515, partial [Dehalococcoidales bacterium]|nr:hypothetical protein [Dehalococcoidales bacterium]
MFNLGLRHLVAAVFGSLLFLMVVFPGRASAEGSPVVTSSPQLSPPLTGTIPQGGWIAYRLSYPGDSSKVDLSLTYSPSDDPNDRGKANGEQVKLAVYSPSAPPPNGQPIAWAGGNGGRKEYRLESSLGGDYIFIVDNWDSLGRPVGFGLSAVRVGNDGGSDAGQEDAGLVFVSASDGVASSAQANANLSGKRVGLQAGHWESAQLPAELA